MSADPGADAESQRDRAIFRAEQARDEQKAQLSQREADNDAAGSSTPRLRHELGRDRILADKACSKGIGDAWREYVDSRVAYFDQQLAEHDQAYAKRMQSLDPAGGE